MNYKSFQSSSERASKTASRIRAFDTKPEMILRKTLWELGLRYRKNVRHLPGKPDIVFGKQKLIIFCDGDFWHGRDWASRRRKLANGSNSEYWIQKIQSNIRRDKLQVLRLNRMGWSVLRFWESDILKDPSAIARQITQTMKNRGSNPG